ncbi:hypothetical protein BACCAP_01757 [Pseudoflavonifractor capillosus ATCC 29799]|uniref:Uncharacterized protein n=1 Tax=Pseudoflavonifractor capillosus ATCC 29799 TaxID=411467 RepID=A6NU75_9FIRM|nr:hypothetical protein BACCAP_01757 [Pseudoflavonifractor capillosus ATCC 29799]
MLRWTVRSQRNSSQSFHSEHTFFSIRLAAESIKVPAAIWL